MWLSDVNTIWVVLYHQNRFHNHFKYLDKRNYVWQAHRHCKHLVDIKSFRKAKISKDELEEKLVQATSEENWQTSTNILHEIANAAYN